MRSRPAIDSGPYDIRDSLGRGGYGRKGIGRRLAAHRDVAITILLLPLLQRFNRVSRFQREKPG